MNSFSLASKTWLAMLAWCRNFEIDKGSKWVKNEWSSWAFKDSHKVIFCPASGAGASPLMSPFTMLCCLVLMYSSEAWKHWKPRSLNPIGPKLSKEPTWKENKRRSLLQNRPSCSQAVKWGDLQLKHMRRHLGRCSTMKLPQKWCASWCAAYTVLL